MVKKKKKKLFLNENLDQARKILKKYNIEENSESFLKLKELVESKFGENKLGYLGLLTKFFYQKEVDLSEIAILVDKIFNNRSNLSKLPKQISTYDSFEKLTDDLTKLEQNKNYNKEFVSQLKGNLKKEARKDSELVDIYSDLDEDKKKDLIDNFIKPKVSRYKDYKRFREELITYLYKNNLSKEEILNDIEKVQGAYLYYEDDSFIVAEIFSPNSSCKLGSKSWCISTSKYFFNIYSGIDTGNKQYFIWNLKVESTSQESLVGVTISPNGRVHTSHLKNDRYVNFKQYCSKHGLDLEIFKPLDLETDLEKLFKSFNTINFSTINKLNKSGDITEILKKHSDKLDDRAKIFYGLDVDYSSLNENDKRLYKAVGGYPNLPKIIDFCNNVSGENPSSYVQNNKDNPGKILLDEMPFYEKIILLGKVLDLFDDELSIKVFLNKEYEGRVEFDIELDEDITFFFYIEEEQYCQEILGMELSTYFEFMHRSVVDTVDDENLFDQIGPLIRMKLNELADYIKDYVSHPKEREMISNIDRYEEFVVLCEIMKKLSGSDKLADLYEDLVSEISYKLDNLHSEDIRNFEFNKVGEYDYNYYKIDLSEMVPQFVNETNPDKLKNFEDWFDSCPSDIENTSVSFGADEGFLLTHYLDHSGFDYKDIIDNFDIKIDELMDEGLENISQELKLKKIIDNLIDNNWKPEKRLFRTFYLTYYIDKDRARVIKKSDIKSDGSVLIHEIDTSECNKDLEDVIFRLLGGISNDEVKKCLRIKKGNISVTSSDPDQMKLFENVQPYEKFKQNFFKKYN